MSIPESIKETKEYLLENGFPDKIESVVILGSGLGAFTDSVLEQCSIPYERIPNFPVTSVEGHHGRLISAVVKNHPILIFSGRFHHYEGYSLSKTVLPIHISKSFHANKIIISNAAGAVNPSFQVGDLMVIDDIFRFFHKITISPSNTFTYTLYPFAEKSIKIASSIGLDVHRGTYLYMKGPNYETKAEIRAFQKLGVDVVGMSTAPELMEASRLEIPAVAVSLITNMAAGLSKNKLDHSEVKLAADSRKEDFTKFVIDLIDQL